MPKQFAADKCLTNGHTPNELLHYLKSKKISGLFEEYDEISYELPPISEFSASRLKCNVDRNRYLDVPALDSSRVILNSENDYINANFVDGFDREKAFIVTQGPLASTQMDFWQMCWEQRVSVIVMTTSCFEKGRQKCVQYWPSSTAKSKTFQWMTVEFVRCESNPDYDITHLLFTNTNWQEQRPVVHMLYRGWPDQGVPHSASGLIDFVLKVRLEQDKLLQKTESSLTDVSIPPIVVHCSAGIGRSGTFCTLEVAMHCMDAHNKVSIKDLVSDLRRQRAYSIQTPDQYVFLYLAVLEYAVKTSRLLSEDVDEVIDESRNVSVDNDG